MTRRVRVPDIRPIETSYGDCRFRSRAEARWAVFFDALGIRWEHEPQGYAIDGNPYLPDFLLFLPGKSVFAEVKPGDADNFEGDHVDLCRSLAQGSGRPVLLLVGIPSHRMYHQFAPGLDPNAFQAAFFSDEPDKLITADEYWFAKADVDQETGALEFRFDKRGLRKSFGDRLVDAVRAARSARFEHGETGALS